MRVSTLLTASAAGVMAQDAISAGPLTGSRGNATVTINNPSNVAYVATLPAAAFDTAAFPDGGNVKGRIWAQSRPDGIGVTFSVSFSNLPKTGGPFTYHIHAAPVSASGNCTSAAGHLDPFVRNDDPPCDATLQQTCQVGDLSGKHGKITADPFNVTYRDLFASTDPSSAAFIGNLSFVLHYPNKTRITCANFVQEAATTLPSGHKGSNGGASGTSANSTVPAPTGSASPSKTPASFVTVSAAAAGAGSLATRAAAMGAGAVGVLAAVALAL
ncbi:Cell surface superoxide dismutase [Cu-Zn] 4 [Sporothrix stenoceras]|uniref:Cell surface superoxide dismutase [Cu-Zn] 4 n=1 Tax=Sporothrix stenoceras TaxID=5173 RepID=A0ABR3YX74_9PEZI